MHAYMHSILYFKLCVHAGMAAVTAIFIASSICLVILLVAVLCHKHGRQPASGQQESSYEYIFSPPQLPPPQQTICANPAYEKIAINNNVAYSNGLSQDQQL